MPKSGWSSAGYVASLGVRAEPRAVPNPLPMSCGPVIGFLRSAEEIESGRRGARRVCKCIVIRGTAKRAGVGRDLQSHVDALSAQFGRLSSENQFLKSKLKDGEVPDIPPAAIEELKRVGVAEFCLLWKHIAMQVGDGRLMVDGKWWMAGNGGWMMALQEVAHLAQLLDQAVEPVVQERARLASQLSSHIRNTPARPTALDATAALTAVDELAELLQRNMQLELRTHDNVTDFLWLSTLSPVQGARVVAAAYPFVPDALAILHACRQLLGS
eukprot:XP_001697761.1 predicted protein [Chlamydomonas reinhardtii]